MFAYSQMTEETADTRHKIHTNHDNDDQYSLVFEESKALYNLGK